MDKTVEKYLAKMVEGYEANIPQIETAIENTAAQVKGMTEQRDQMATELLELKKLLGLSEENDGSMLRLVNDEKE